MQQHIRKTICILLCALMLMSALFGCTDKTTPESERFVLRASVCGWIGSLDPAMNTDAKAESVFFALYENLMRAPELGTESLEATPGIAKEYTEIVNGDGTVEYVFTLRASARWSDGTRVKAHDFVYAWRRLVDPATDSPNHEILSMVKGYDEVRETGDTSRLALKEEGETTFRVTLAGPCPYFIDEVCTAVATMPLRSDEVQTNPDWSRSSALLCDGPYQIGAWIWEDYIQLRRNQSYYNIRSEGPDTLRYVFAADTQEALRLYQEGRVDYTAVSPLEAEFGERVPLRTTVCVLYNHMSEAFSNTHVRRAFDLALNRSALAAAVRSDPASGFVPPGVLDNRNGEQDFRAAGGTLCAVDEENYTMRCLDAVNELRNGGFWGGVGFPAVSCIYPEEDALSAAAASAAAAMWTDKLNLIVAAEGVTRGEYERRLSEGEYDLAIGAFSVRCGDALDCLASLASLAGENVLRYMSTPYDLLIGVAKTSHDSAARAAFLHDAEALMLEEAALSPLFFASEVCLLREDFTGVCRDLRGNEYFSAVTRVEKQ